MKKETVNYIIKLLERELEQEYIKGTPKATDLDYIKELFSASRDFTEHYGTLKQQMEVANMINEIVRSDYCDR